MGKIVQIPLTQGLFASINEEDYHLVKDFKWYAHFSNDGRRVYARSYDPNCYIIKSRTKAPLRMHRIIMGVTHDDPILVDHRNHNGLDNTRSNLRKCTKSENNRNCNGARRGSSSRYLGVFRRVMKTCVRWRAGLSVSGKTYWLGHYETEEQAAIAYNEAAIKHFGEFASLNKINDTACRI